VPCEPGHRVHKPQPRSYTSRAVTHRV
jgi:hypothetical protein